MADYSDVELRLMTEIAYLDLDGAYAMLSANTGRSSFAVEELIEVALSMGDDGLTSDQVERYSKLTYAEKKIISEWRISEEPYDHDDSGFYACIIETDQGASIAYRGSEDMCNLEHLEEDWLNADLGLLNSTLTSQQAACDEFLSKHQNTLNKYDDLTMVGHSLGGNLAEYSTVVSEKYGLDDNISSCYSLDGPGFSNEFIANNISGINKMKHKMKHYSASAVGRMLNPLPGVENVFVESSSTGFGRHSTSTWGRNGNSFKEGKQDALSVIFELLTQGVDKLPTAVGNLACDFVCVLAYTFIWGKGNLFDKDGNLTAGGAMFFYMFIVLCVETNGLPIAVVAGMAAVVLVVAAAGIALELTVELVKYVVAQVCKAIVAAWNWTTDMIEQLYNGIVEAWKKLAQFYNETFNVGYKYATANPEFIVDTYKLRNYADRLDAVNRKVTAIDIKLDSLYRKICNLEDLIGTAKALWRLMQADILISYSLRLKSCSLYLDNTADDFEKAENNVNNKVIQVG